MSAPTATAQECQTDQDCGFGFRCKHDTAGNTTGGDWEVYCGNEICDGDEDAESCPDDCEEYTYCVGAPCEVDSDCSEDYSCQQAGGEYSTTTSGNICGNAICEAGESVDTCWSDCTTEQTCQPKQCESDDDCEEGYTCEQVGGSAVASSTDGTTGTIHLVQTQCVNWGSSGSGGNASSGSSGVGGAGGADGDDTSNTSVSITASSGTVGGVSGGSVNGTGGGSASGSDGAGNGGPGSGSGGNHGGHHPGHGWPWPKGHGCSFAAVPATAGSPLWALGVLAGSAFMRRRRRRD